MESRLGRQIKQLVGALNNDGIQFALIGGLALASHKVVRATQDIDLLIEAGDADTVDELLIKLGYQCIHRSTDAANYQRNDERVDLLYADRPIARQLLHLAVKQETSFGILRVVSMEGSMKSIKSQLAAEANQPVAGGAVIENLPVNSLNPYERFADLMVVVEVLCPKWPDRETFKDSDVFLL